GGDNASRARFGVRCVERFRGRGERGKEQDRDEVEAADRELLYRSRRSQHALGSKRKQEHERNGGVTDPPAAADWCNCCWYVDRRGAALGDAHVELSGRRGTTSMSTNGK